MSENILTDSVYSLIEENGKKLFIKKIGFNAKIYGDISLFHKYLLDYVEQLEQAGIQLTPIKKSYIENNRVVFVTEYSGEGIAEKMKNEKPEDFIRLNKKQILKMLDIIKMAQKGRVFLDPHIKNFVFADSGKICYTDFSPPYTKKYLKFKLEHTSDKDKEMIKKIFTIFSPDELGYHFMADLIKMNKDYMIILKELYSLLKEKGIISLDYEESLKKAIHIKEIEEEKRRRNLYFSPL